MTKALEVGDRVVYQFFNSVDRRFYGEQYLGTITQILDQEGERWYTVRGMHEQLVKLHRKEIVRRYGYGKSYV